MKVSVLLFLCAFAMITFSGCTAKKTAESFPMEKNAVRNSLQNQSSRAASNTEVDEVDAIVEELDESLNSLSADNDFQDVTDEDFGL